MWRSHLLNLLLYSLGVSLMLALYYRSDRKEQIRLAIKIWSVMVVAAFLIGWVMLLLGDL